MFADITLSTEAIVVISALLSAMATAIAAMAYALRVIYLKMVSNYDKMVGWKTVATDAVAVTEVAANKERIRKGEEPLVPVVCEPLYSQFAEKMQFSHKMADLAEQEKMKARAVVAAMTVGVPAPLVDSLRPGDLPQKT